jgi:hypothetical protein
MRRLWVGAAVVLAALLALGIQTSVVTRTGFLMGDFRAFYCAARVASQGADPYHTEPLRSCETAIGPKVFFEKNPGVTIPAPLPGYALAALVPLAMLPFGIAAALWAALLLLAVTACIVALARFGAVSWEIALAVFALSLGMLSLPFGEVVPLALGFICLAAYAAWRGRPRAAAFLAAGAMVEPHLGLPACIALAVWLPATRVPLALSFAALGSLSLILLGPVTNLEYVSSVLPAHALSEITRDTQYSLTAVLASLGVAPGIAMRAGLLCYIAMLAAGTFVGGRLARQTRNDAFVVCMPVAFAVFGGTFIHATQIAAALPAAVLIVTTAPREYRPWGVAAMLLLAVPWGWAVSPALMIAPLFPIGFLAWRYWGDNLAVVLLVAIAAAALTFGLEMLYTLAVPLTLAHAAGTAIDPRLAEASWSIYSQNGSKGSLAAWAVRLPTWAGLVLLLIASTRAAGLQFSKNRALGLVAALCVLFPIAGQMYGDRSGAWLMVDFRAYYCASLAQREGFDPYFSQPLHGCENSTPAPYYRAPAKVTVPAPYPPYALALLAPLTLLPFDIAAMLWWGLLALAIAIAAYALAQAAKQPLLIAWAALALSLGLTSFASGNVMPLSLAAVVVAALCAARGRPALAVAAMAVATVEPQIALPAALGLFIAYPAIRLRLALTGAVIAALSIVSGGLYTSIDYLAKVLPAHALSEVSRDNQYSLSTVLAALGVPDASAAVAGSISYLAMTGLGLFVGLRLACRYDDLALAVLVPPAFAVFGGSFVHVEQIAAAVPACLLLVTHAQVQRGWLGAALLLLAVPWMMATSAALFLAPIFPLAYLAYTLWRNRTLVLAMALVAFVVIFGLFALAQTPGPATVHAHIYPLIDPRLAEASWRQLVLGNVTNRPVMWLLRLPSWAGLVAFMLPALLLARRPQLALATESA